MSRAVHQGAGTHLGVAKPPRIPTHEWVYFQVKGDVPMSIYMLNLMFDPANPVEQSTGSFLPYVVAPPPAPPPQNWLLVSKVWLMPNPNITNPNWDTPADWQQFQEDTSLLTLAKNDQIYIRICSKTVPANWTGKVTVLVARNTKRASKGGDGKPFQIHASPFPLVAGGSQSLVLFQTPNWQAQSDSGSWWWDLGNASITTANAPAGAHDSYSVVAAINAGPGGPPPTEYFIYSHDPDMD